MPYYQEPVLLDRGDYTTATINLYGGIITSWRIKNKEMLFVPRITEFDGLKSIYGGLKMYFPYFGHSNHGPRNGFSKVGHYTLEEAPRKLKNGDIQTVICLENNKFTESISHMKFKIAMKVTLSISQLNIYISVKNTCQHFPMYFTLMRNCTVKVKDLSKCQLLGLKEIGYVYSNEPYQPLRDWEDFIKCAELTIPRVYENIPEEICLTNISDTKKMIFTHNSPVELLTWNPYKNRIDKGPDPAPDQANMADQCYAVGMGEVLQPVRLEPRDEWSFSGDVIVVDEEEEKRKRALQSLNLFDYVSKFC